MKENPTEKEFKEVVKGILSINPDKSLKPHRIFYGQANKAEVQAY